MTTLTGARVLAGVCHTCRQQLIRSQRARHSLFIAPAALHHHPRQQRTFAVSNTLQKKGAKPSKHQDVISSNSPATSKSGATATDDPYDFSELDANIAKAHDKLKQDLSKLRGGGRFNTDLIDDLRVQLDKASKSTIRLGDLAQVVPKGRIVNIMVGERDHVKHVASAIQNSDLSLTPQIDPQNPLQVNITIPPPTTESRQQAVKAATKSAEVATNAVRNARQIQHKKLREMQLGKKARPDDLKKAGDRMEKVIEAGVAEAKKIADSAKKVLETA